MVRASRPAGRGDRGAGGLTERRTGWDFRIAFALCAALLLVPIWIPTYPPMADLPQHAAQVAMWHEATGGEPPHDGLLSFNWPTPYLGGYTLTWLLAFVVPVRIALKLVVTAALLAVPLLVGAHIRRVGGDPWWTLAAFAGLLGFPFYWGFLNFLVAVPFGLLLLLLVGRYTERPDGRLGWAIAGLALALFLLHALLFAFVFLAATGWLLLASLPLRARVSAVARLGLAAVPPLVWVLLLRGAEAGARAPAEWELGLVRVPMAGSLFWAVDLSATSAVLGLALLATPFVMGGRITWRGGRWVPLAACVVILLLAPSRILGTALVFQRFAALLMPCLLIALGPSRRTVRGAGRWLPVLAVVAWLGWSGAKSLLYAREVGPLDEVIAGAPGGARLLYAPLDRSSEHLPYPVFLHSGAWYTVEKGGLADFSFAEFFPQLVRYEPGEAPGLKSLPGDPVSFGWRDAFHDTYDLVLVRSETDPRATFMARAVPDFALVEREGPWWLFGNCARMGGRPACPG